MFAIYQVLSQNNDNFLKFNRFGIHIFFIRAMLVVQFCRLRVILVNRHISARNASWIARQYAATLFHMNQCESKGFLKNESVHTAYIWCKVIWIRELKELTSVASMESSEGVRDDHTSCFSVETTLSALSGEQSCLPLVFYLVSTITLSTL